MARQMTVRQFKTELEQSGGWAVGEIDIDGVTLVVIDVYDGEADDGMIGVDVRDGKEPMSLHADAILNVR